METVKRDPEPRRTENARDSPSMDRRGMTSEMITSMAPARVLEAARRFFTGNDRMADAWIDSESDTHIAFGTFRGNLAIAAFPDPEDPERTRIRVTTLREEGLVPRLMTRFDTLGPGSDG